MSDNLLEVRGLTRHFTLDGDSISRLAGKTRTLKAVDEIDFAIRRGETLGLVGESGCGKSGGYRDSFCASPKLFPAKLTDAAPTPMDGPRNGESV